MKENYYKELNSNEWKLKRLEVLKRDKYKCLKCGCTENLHVHHRFYVKGKKAWEYSLKVFQTLCKNCHELHHKNNSIVVRSEEKKVNRSRKDKNQDRIQRMLANLPQKDLILQSKYDKAKKNIIKHSK